MIKLIQTGLFVALAGVLLGCQQQTTKPTHQPLMQPDMPPASELGFNPLQVRLPLALPVKQWGKGKKLISVQVYDSALGQTCAKLGLATSAGSQTQLFCQKSDVWHQYPIL